MKKQVRKALATVAIPLSLVFAGSAHADLTLVKITAVASYIDTGPLIAVEFDPDIKNGVCERNDILMFDPTDPTHKVMLADVIASKINQNNVYLADSGTCVDTFNGSTVGRYRIMKSLK